MKTVIEMAREAGLHKQDETFYANKENLERFAALVREDEREACANVCEAGINNAEDWDSSYWDSACESRAAAIRARNLDDLTRESQLRGEYE